MALGSQALQKRRDADGEGCGVGAGVEMSALEFTECGVRDQGAQPMRVVEGDERVVAGADDQGGLPDPMKLRRTIEGEQHADPRRRHRQGRHRRARRRDGLGELRLVRVEPGGVVTEHIA